MIQPLLEEMGVQRISAVDLIWFQRLWKNMLDLSTIVISYKSQALSALYAFVTFNCTCYLVYKQNISRLDLNWSHQHIFTPSMYLFSTQLSIVDVN